MINTGVAEFEKVSFERFLQDFRDLYPLNSADDEWVRNAYDDIRLPVRATQGSVGYDFFMPFEMGMFYADSIRIPTGIRCKIDDGWGLFLFPRSGLGFKHAVSLANTIGVIDSDYYFSDNEGHIMVKLCNDSVSHNFDGGMNLYKEVQLEKGSGYCQGIFLPCGFVREEGAPMGVRNGGFGSTGV